MSVTDDNTIIYLGDYFWDSAYIDYTMAVTGSAISCVLDSGALTLSIDALTVGTATVTITAKGSGGDSDVVSDVFDVTVTDSNSNSNPVFIGPTSLPVIDGIPQTFNLASYYSDPDVGDILNYLIIHLAQYPLHMRTSVWYN
jgi:hypothetical protein